MRTIICIILIMAGFCHLIADERSPSAQKCKEKMDMIDFRENIIASLGKAADAAALESIANKIFSFNIERPATPKDNYEWRHMEAELWLRLIDKGQSKVVPLDTKNPPVLNVAPPMGATGVSGMDPSAIKDPKLRAEYERAIKTNAEKIHLWNEQIMLQRRMSGWRDEFKLWISGNYNDDKDKGNAELGKLVNEYISSEKLRQELRALLSIKQVTRRPKGTRLKTSMPKIENDWHFFSETFLVFEGDSPT